jgi:hypothetical protein
MIHARRPASRELKAGKLPDEDALLSSLKIVAIENEICRAQIFDGEVKKRAHRIGSVLL